MTCGARKNAARWVFKSEKPMTIRYANGQILEAVLLSRTETTLRVAIPGSEDSAEFTLIHGVWVSEDCEPAEVEFSWGRHARAAEVREADCVCPHELAARLIHMLYSGEQEAAAAAPPAARGMAMALAQQVV